jgi:uroporphyrinogen decarboxylase
MDLSVEAEAFGATVRVSDDEVPTIIGAIITDEDEADALQIPAVGTARTGIYLEAIEKATKVITDRPVFAGVIGPFSLAGRLMDVSEIMIYCYDEPDMVHTVLEKAAAFLIDYCHAFRDAGANGVVMAEPLAGMLSPNLAREFSHPYVKKIIDAVQTDTFCVIYHNCGNNVPLMTGDIYGLGALGYHFGDAIDMMAVLPQAPVDVLVMGNVSPSAQFRGGTPESIAAVTRELMGSCGKYSNFVISGGCDIPPQSPWENIDAFFRAAMEGN